MSSETDATSGPSLRSKVDDIRAYVKQIMDPRLEDVEDEQEDLRRRVANLESHIQGLHEQLDSLAGLADDAASTPEKRALDLRILLRNAAEARDSGKVSWTYNQVRDQLQANGHGKIHDPQAYRAMDDAAEIDGYAVVENSDGQTVIRCSAAALADQAPVNENNNGGGVGDGSDTRQNHSNQSMI